MHALRFVLLAASVLALAASANPNSFSQRGTVGTPRAARHDGQPLATKVRLEGHLGTTVRSAIAARDGAPLGPDGSGAAVAQNEGGAAVRVRANQVLDLGVEVDAAWSPTATTRAGTPTVAPDAMAIDTAFTVRASHPLGDGVALGWAVDVGGHQVPVQRRDGTGTTVPDGTVSRPLTLLARLSVVPSYRRGPVALYGSVGYASDSEVPAVIATANPDPGAVARNRDGALVMAAGLTFDLGRGTRLSTRVGDAFTSAVPAGHYGPQVDVGLAVDVDP